MNSADAAVTIFKSLILMALLTFMLNLLHGLWYITPMMFGMFMFGSGLGLSISEMTR